MFKQLLAAQELRQHKITVNSYAPGFILTPMRTFYDTIARTRSNGGILVAHPDDDKYGGHGSVAKMEG